MFLLAIATSYISLLLSIVVLVLLRTPIREYIKVSSL
jgi:hypothetical protein